MINNINSDFLKRVYAFDDYTINEILCKFYQKIQEVITDCNEAFSIVEWLKEEGLQKEVINQLEIWLEDGTLANIINVEKFNVLKQEMLNELAEYETTITNDVNEMKTEVNNQVSDLTDSVNETMDNYKTEIDGKIATLTNNQNEFTTNVNNSISTMQNTLSKIKHVSTYNDLVNAVNDSHTSGQTIYITSGTYTLTDILFLGNNTKLIGVGDVIFKSNTLNIMISNYCNNATLYGGTYNIEINNITFEGNNRVDGFTLVGFSHADNVKIINCSFRNLHQWHMIELNGCQHGLIENCSFNNYGTSGSTGTEVIQLDIARDNTCFPWFGNYDNTNCNFITIRNCKFENVGNDCACVGNHSYKANYPITNVLIENCYANKIGYFCRLRDFKNLSINHNQIKDARYGYFGSSIETTSHGLTLDGNEFVGRFTGAAIDVDERFVCINPQGINNVKYPFQNVKIINNRISNTPSHAIGACINDCIISNNTIVNSFKNGLYYHGGVDWVITNNIFSQTGMEGGNRYAIYIYNGGDNISKAVVTNNVVYNRNAIYIGKSGDFNLEKVIIANNVGSVTNTLDTSVSATCSISNNI